MLENPTAELLDEGITSPFNLDKSFYCYYFPRKMQTATMQFGVGLVGPREANTHFPQQHHYYYAQPHNPLQHATIISRSEQPTYSLSLGYPTAARSNANPYRQPHPQSPPSPPRDEVGKPSLPSISSLLHIAGSDRIGSDTGTLYKSI